MEPIINPWWIYFASKSETVACFLLVFGFISIFAFIVLSALYYSKDIEIKPKKILIILGTIFMIIGGLLPTEKTIYTMMTISKVTPDNIELAGNTAKDIVDYIYDKIDNILENEDEKNKTK